MRKPNLAALALAPLLFALGCGGSTKDVGSDRGAETGACPASAPIGATCSGTLHCEYGTESCCGKTHPSTVCDCSSGSFACYATDACLMPSCPDGGASQCASDGECAAPAICKLCADGHSYSCATAACVAGACEVQYPACPAVDAGACPASVPIGETCSGTLHCEYGTETCCGKTYPSTVCDCSGSGFACYATDACMLPPGWCPDAGAPQCTADSECPSPKAPCHVCSDGTTYSCPQGTCTNGVCGVTWTACP